MTALKNGTPLLMDGAMGTEIERRGAAVDQLGWSALAIKEQPDVIRQIHGDYLHAGASLHIVNSFALSKHVLDSIGWGDALADLNARSVALFDSAVRDTNGDRSALWAGGSVSTFAAFSDRRRLPAATELFANTHQQAEILYNSGVDFFALEMLFDVDTSVLMLDAVKDFELPVIVGFTCEYLLIDGAETLCCRRMGEALLTFEETIRQFTQRVEHRNLIVAIMHADFAVCTRAIGIVRRYWQGPIAVYPNSGEFINLKLQFDTVNPVDEFCAVAAAWLQQGVQIVGGCCGIRPEHIQALGRRLFASNQ